MYPTDPFFWRTPFSGVRGVRIRVKDVLDMLAAGATGAEILESYPYLEREDIQASLEYAARLVDHAVLSWAK